MRRCLTAPCTKPSLHLQPTLIYNRPLHFLACFRAARWLDMLVREFAANQSPASRIQLQNLNVDRMLRCSYHLLLLPGGRVHHEILNGACLVLSFCWLHFALLYEKSAEALGLGVWVAQSRILCRQSWAQMLPWMSETQFLFQYVSVLSCPSRAVATARSFERIREF